jgi:hypothetical protein
MRLQSSIVRKRNVPGPPKPSMGGTNGREPVAMMTSSYGSSMSGTPFSAAASAL